MRLRFRKGSWHVGEQRISPHETLILFALMSHPYLTMEEVIGTLWPDPDYEPEVPEKSIWTEVHWLRRKLAGAGWTINKYPRGYVLERAVPEKAAA